jgi:hypothetical protein
MKEMSAVEAESSLSNMRVLPVRWVDCVPAGAAVNMSAQVQSIDRIPRSQ